MTAPRSKHPQLIDLEVGSTRLKSKPSAQLSFSILPAKGHSKHENSLIVFLSGLENPQTIWKPTITKFVSISEEEGWPTMLTYDRFGSGESDRDPADIGKDPENWHDVLDVVRDLRELIISVAGTRADVETDINKLRIIFVAHSLGCAVARLYAQTYPRTVTHLLLLDSAPSIRDPVTMIPDPLALGFQESDLPAGITAEMCAKARDNFRKSSYNPNASNSEGLNWKHLIDQLPSANEPMLEGPDGTGLFLTVVKHDPAVLAKQYKRFVGNPEIVTATYQEPRWSAFLQRLTQITPPEFCRGPILAQGCGHYIPIENHALVAAELRKLLRRESRAKSAL